MTNSGGGERKEQEAPGLVSEAWRNTQIVPVSAANPAEEHDTTPSLSSSQPIGGRRSARAALLR